MTARTRSDVRVISILCFYPLRSPTQPMGHMGPAGTSKAYKRLLLAYQNLCRLRSLRSWLTLCLGTATYMRLTTMTSLEFRQSLLTSQNWTASDDCPSMPPNRTIWFNIYFSNLYSPFIFAAHHLPALLVYMSCRGENQIMVCQCGSITLHMRQLVIDGGCVGPCPFY